MNRLKNILQSNLFYYISLILILIYVFITTVLIKYESYYKDGNISLTSVITKVSKSKDKQIIYLKDKEWRNKT